MAKRSARARSRMRGNLPGQGQGVAQLNVAAAGAGGMRMVETDAMSRLEQYMYLSQAMPRDPRDTVPFGPLNPLVPVQIDPSRPDTRRAEPRISEYEQAVNLPGMREHHHVDWDTLLNASESVDIMRRCIELRKDHLAGLKFAFTVSPEAIAEAQRTRPGDVKADIEAELRDKYLTDINRATDFWKRPWRTHGVDFEQWVRGVMEQHLVYDGVVVYPECSWGGDILAMNLIDARTIKPLRDYRGQRPQAPFPAFQQMLYGWPRGEFTATPDGDPDNDGNITISDGYLADQMHYYRKNFRVQSMYGYGPTEQALIAARLYLRRKGWMLAEYDDGVVPQLIMRLSETTALTPRERVEYEAVLNDELTGQTSARHRAKVAFPGMDPVLLPSVDERYKPDYDMFLLRMIATFYGVSMTSLGFQESKGLGSAGMHEAQADSEEIASINPDKTMITDLINVLSHDFLRIPAQVIGLYVEDEGDDTLEGEQANQILLATGQATLNDGRRRTGQPLYDMPEADEPFIVGGQNGIVFVRGLLAAQDTQQKAALKALTAPTPSPAGQDQARPGGGQDQAQPDDPQDNPQPVDKNFGSRDLVKVAELKAYRAWQKRGVRARSFEWTAHSADEVADIMKAAGSEPDLPKEQAPEPGLPAQPPDDRWPAWAWDTILATLVAGKLTAALIRGLGISALVARLVQWAQAYKPGDPLPNVAAWLVEQGVDVAVRRALTPVISEAMAEAAVLGVKSAQAALETDLLTAALGQITVDWDGWKPGNIRAARRILSADGADVGLQRLLDDAGVTISRIAENRLDEVAAVLADGLERGLGPQEIARALRGVVDDPVWALTVAWTETNRAQSAAALDQYRTAGKAGKAWMTAHDQRVCPICQGNQDEGGILLDQVFASGEQYPPAHPRCRCAVVPARRVDMAKAFNPLEPRDAHGCWSALGEAIDALEGRDETVIHTERMRVGGQELAVSKHDGEDDRRTLHFPDGHSVTVHPNDLRRMRHDAIMGLSEEGSGAGDRIAVPRRSVAREDTVDYSLQHVDESEGAEDGNGDLIGVHSPGEHEPHAVLKRQHLVGFLERARDMQADRVDLGDRERADVYQAGGKTVIHPFGADRIVLDRRTSRALSKAYDLIDEDGDSRTVTAPDGDIRIEQMSNGDTVLTFPGHPPITQKQGHSGLFSAIAGAAGLEKALGSSLSKALDGGTPAGVAGTQRLHAYWVRGKGRARWIGSPTPFRTLRVFLAKYIHDPKELNATTAQWVFDATGHHPGKGHGGPGFDKAFNPHQLRDPLTGRWIKMGEDLKKPKAPRVPRVEKPKAPAKPRAVGHVVRDAHVSQLAPGDHVKVRGRYSPVIATHRYGTQDHSIVTERGTLVVPNDSRHKVRTTRPEFQPVTGEQAKHLASIVADSQKPGRMADASVPTRRELKIVEREKDLKYAGESAAEHRARGERTADRLKRTGARRDDYMAEYMAEHDAHVAAARADLEEIRSRPHDPAGIDKPHGPMIPAQSVDPARPLAVYGDMLTVHNKDARTYQSLLDLEKVDPDVHRLLAKEYADASYDAAGIYVGSGPVPDLDDLGYLRQETKHTHASDARSSWDGVGGVQTGRTTAIGYAGDWGMDTVHEHSTATHELGHALSRAMTRNDSGNNIYASDGPDWRERHAAVQREAGAALNPYYNSAEEMWAEGFSQYTMGKADSGSAARIARRFHISLATAREMSAYYESIEQAVKGMS